MGRTVCAARQRESCRPGITVLGGTKPAGIEVRKPGGIEVPKPGGGTKPAGIEVPKPEGGALTGTPLTPVGVWGWGALTIGRRWQVMSGECTVTGCCMETVSRSAPGGAANGPCMDTRFAGGELAPLSSDRRGRLPRALAPACGLPSARPLQDAGCSTFETSGASMLLSRADRAPWATSCAPG